MRQIDGEVIAADSAGLRVAILLGKTPDGGPKTFAMRHDQVGTITAVIDEAGIDRLVAMLIAARDGGDIGDDLAVADFGGAPIAIHVDRSAEGRVALALAHPIGTIAGILAPDALDEMIAELQALRVEAA